MPDEVVIEGVSRVVLRLLLAVVAALLGKGRGRGLRVEETDELLLLSMVLFRSGKVNIPHVAWNMCYRLSRLQ